MSATPSAPDEREAFLGRYAAELETLAHGLEILQPFWPTARRTPPHAPCRSASRLWMR